MRLFGTDGVRGKANKYPITAEIALKLGKAAAIVLRNTENRKPVFLIGKDTRLSGYMLEFALTSGLTSMGADVYLVGPVPTPAVAHLTRSFACDAGIMISASHNPADDNGIKFFNFEGFKLPDEVEDKIEKLVFTDLSTDHVTSKEIGRAYRIEDAGARYIEFAKGTINNMSLKGIKLVLDCANGAAYKVAPLIFRELGAEVVLIGNLPDGHNINKECGALYLDTLTAEVKKTKADCGIALDGDADRVIMVDETGKTIDGDHIIAIAALTGLARNRLNKKTVVVTEYTNLAFDALIKENGGKVVRTKNGDRYVIEEMVRGKYNLGGEFSGHIIFSDYNSTGDGTIAALQVLRIMKEQGKKLSILCSVLEKYPQITVNVKVKEKRPLETIPKIAAEIKAAEKKLGKEGRYIVRYSGTEMLCRVTIEGKDLKKITEIAERIASEIRNELS